MRIILIGMMGSGKSTVGKLLAGKLKWKFYDSDQLIEREQGSSVAQIFESQGEPAFRKMEREMIARLAREDPSVIATGGGVPLLEENWKSISNDAAVVWLKASAETIFDRMNRGGSKGRPLIKDSLSMEKISQMLKERKPFYAKASLTIETDALSPDEAAEKILRLAMAKSG